MKNISNIILILSLIFLSSLCLLEKSINGLCIYISVLLGILSAKYGSNGKWLMFVFDILSYVLYTFVCIKERYLGELLLSYFIIIVNFFCIVEWRQNQECSFVKINNITKRELFFCSIIAFLGFCIYFVILYSINCNMAFANALSSVMFLLSTYFCFRRSVMQYYFLIVYEICFISLWFFSIANVRIENIMFLIGGVTELCYCFKGLHNWHILGKKQSITVCYLME